MLYWFCGCVGCENEKNGKADSNFGNDCDTGSSVENGKDY